MMNKEILNYKIPEDKKKLLTVDFLNDLKQQINLSVPLYEQRDTYWRYLDISESFEFMKVLELCCCQFNLTESIYNYIQSLCVTQRKLFMLHLIDIMVEHGVIPNSSEDDFEYYYPDYNLM